MASGTGNATIDFGASPGANEAQVVVTGQGSIGAGSNVEAYWRGDDSTGAHPADDHKYVGVFVTLTCGAVVPGTGFTIFARTPWRMQGQFICRFVWAD